MTFDLLVETKNPSSRELLAIISVCGLVYEIVEHVCRGCVRVCVCVSVCVSVWVCVRARFSSFTHYSPSPVAAQSWRDSRHTTARNPSKRYICQVVSSTIQDTVFLCVFHNVNQELSPEAQFNWLDLEPNPWQQPQRANILCGRSGTRIRVRMIALMLLLERRKQRE